MVGKSNKMGMSRKQIGNRQGEGRRRTKIELTFGIVFHGLKYGADNDRLNDSMFKAIG